jgi:hypothetical protein
MAAKKKAKKKSANGVRARKKASSAKAKKAKKAKAPARRTPARRAAMGPSARERGVTVDQYFANLGAEQASIAGQLRAILAEAAPGANVSIKWGQPVWEQNGPFAYLRGSAKHVTFGFWRGADLEDPRGLLEGEGDRMKHLKIAGDVDEAAVRDLVRQAVALNESQGDPTRR